MRGQGGSAQLGRRPQPCATSPHEQRSGMAQEVGARSDSVSRALKCGDETRGRGGVREQQMGQGEEGRGGASGSPVCSRDGERTSNRKPQRGRHTLRNPVSPVRTFRSPPPDFEAPPPGGLLHFSSEVCLFKCFVNFSAGLP